MDINRLLDALRQDLARAAELGADDVRAAAERLTLALEPALRLALMDGLGQAAAEIGEAWPGVSIGVRLKGRDPQFVVEGAPSPAETPFETDDGEPVARITLRLPEALKGRAEAQAARRGQSLNTWLVAAARAAAADEPRGHGPARHGASGRHMKGWVR
ncbi:MAG TPA: toxin-antitoxin system HicB family antitoxin [Caulobacteraceae bacterium]|nr:toxin-antitoxin system HicB family antitoxin [Caulobacteraceae bacterium]